MPRPEVSTPPGATWLAAVALIVAAGIAAYANSFAGVFLYDDFDSITLNPHIRQLWPLSEAMSRPLRDAAETVSTRPLLSLTFALNYHFGGLDPAGFHAINLAIHLATALLAFAVIRRTLLLSAVGSTEARATGFALAVSLLWVVHPLNTSSVTYIAQRAEALGGLFLLLTIYCAIRGWTTPATRARWMCASVAACTLGVASKETVAAAPVILLLYDRVFIAGSIGAALRQRSLWYLGLAASWLIVIGLLSSDTTALVEQGRGLRYALTQPGVVLRYLRLALWPTPLAMSYHWPLAASAGQVWGPLLVLGALAAGTAWLLIRRHRLAVPAVAFFLVLAPSSSIFALTQVIMEHRMYVPLIAVQIVLVAGADRGRRALALRLGIPAAAYASAAAVASLALVWGTMTYARNADYASEIDFWSKNVAAQPADSIALLQLGRAYLKHGDHMRAHDALARAASLDPAFADLRNELGRALLGLGRQAEARLEFEEAIRLQPGFALAHNNLGIALEQQGAFEPAAASLERALALSPSLALARVNLARVRAAIGTDLARQGRGAEAQAELESALAVDPDNVDARVNLGVLLAGSGKLEAAITHLEHAVTIAPGRPLLHFNLGLALEEHGDLPGASRQFRAELQVDPASRAASDALARVSEQLRATDGGMR